jgi:hypothetical protein
LAQQPGGRAGNDSVDGGTRISPVTRSNSPQAQNPAIDVARRQLETLSRSSNAIMGFGSMDSVVVNTMSGPPAGNGTIDLVHV